MKKLLKREFQMKNVGKRDFDICSVVGEVGDTILKQCHDMLIHSFELTTEGVLKVWGFSK